VMLAVHDSQSYKILPSPSCLEVLSVSIGSSSPITYCLVYIPPNPAEEYLIEFFNYSLLEMLPMILYFWEISIFLTLAGIPCVVSLPHQPSSVTSFSI